MFAVTGFANRAAGIHSQDNVELPERLEVSVLRSLRPRYETAGQALLKPAEALRESLREYIRRGIILRHGYLTVNAKKTNIALLLVSFRSLLAIVIFRKALNENFYQWEYISTLYRAIA